MLVAYRRYDTCGGLCKPQHYTLQAKWLERVGRQCTDPCPKHAMCFFILHVRHAVRACSACCWRTLPHALQNREWNCPENYAECIPSFLSHAPNNTQIIAASTELLCRRLHCASKAPSGSAAGGRHKWQQCLQHVHAMVTAAHPCSSFASDMKGVKVVIPVCASAKEHIFSYS